jgi:hypothetical protein
VLLGLLERDVTKRLGAGIDDVESVKKHPFFLQIDWLKLERRELRSAGLISHIPAFSSLLIVAIVTIALQPLCPLRCRALLPLHTPTPAPARTCASVGV